MAGEAGAEAAALNPAWRGLHWLQGQAAADACTTLGGLDGLSARLCLVCCLHTITFLCASVILKNDVGKALQNG